MYTQAPNKVTIVISQLTAGYFMRTAFSLKQRNWYPYAFLLTALLIGTASIYCPLEIFHKQSLTIIGMAGAFFAFLYTQHLHQTQFFNELFHRFNNKYDSLNEKLDKIIHSESALTPEQQRTLVDYFNLCAEEYMFYKSGHIDSNAWKSWNAGMRYYFSNAKIGEFWRQELKTNSYYGLSISVLSQT